MQGFMLCAALSYTVGCINFAYIMGRIRGLDIRRHGSTNAGASNAFLVLGVKVGVLAGLLDLLKAVLAVRLLALIWGGTPRAQAVAGAACILGHMFPAPMGFKGGKGFASAIGVLLSAFPEQMPAVVGGVILIILLTDYVFLGAIGCAVAMPVLWWLLRRDAIAACIIALSSIAMLMRHRDNFRRLLSGAEISLSRAKPKSAAPDRAEGK